MAFDPPPLTEAGADADPLAQFETWFGEERDAGHDMPEAAAVATANADGAPSVRMVLVKQFDPSGFSFFTNYESAKSAQLSAEPRAAMLFTWLQLHRQVRINGIVERLPEVESDEYYQSRPRASQIGAWSSPQSQVLPSRAFLEERVTQFEQTFADVDEVPRPAYWGGWMLRTVSYEFWQGRPSRLHDRLRYRLGPDDEWVIERLAP